MNMKYGIPSHGVFRFDLPPHLPGMENRAYD